MRKKTIEKVVIWGAGKKGRILLELIENSTISVAALFDNNPDKAGSMVSNTIILSNYYAYRFSDLFWCITIASDQSYIDVRNQLIDMGYNPQKEIQYTELLRMSCDNSDFGDIFMRHEKYGFRFKVLFDCTNGLILGGIEARTIILCDELIKKSNEDIYIVSDSNDPQIEVTEQLYRKIIKSKNNQKGINSTSVVEDLVRIILDNLPCIVVTNQLDNLLLASYMVKQKYPEKIRIISNVAGFTKRIIDGYMSYGILSDYYIGVSESISKELINRGLDSSIVHTLYTPFMCEKNLTRKYSSAGNPIIIGYAGRLDGMKGSQKRVDLVMQLIHTLSARKIDFRVNIAGDGIARSQLEEFITKHNLTSKVTLLGYVKKTRMNEFWKLQDVAINMSDYEGRSISVVEAMGAGAVPVVTDTSGVRDDIVDNENGFIVQLGDVETAADRIEFLYNNRDLLPIIGTKAHDEVWPKSSVDDYVDYWGNLIRKYGGLLYT